MKSKPAGDVFPRVCFTCMMLMEHLTSLEPWYRWRTSAGSGYCCRWAVPDWTIRLLRLSFPGHSILLFALPAICDTKSKAPGLLFVSGRLRIGLEIDLLFYRGWSDSTWRRRDYGQIFSWMDRNASLRAVGASEGLFLASSSAVITVVDVWSTCFHG